MQEVQSPRQILTEVCGFVTIVIGTFLLHATKDMDITLASLSTTAKSSADKSSTFANLSIDPEMQMQRLPLTATGTLDTPTGHRMTNSDRY